MKRSEMVTILEEFFKERTDQDMSYNNSRNLSEMVLHELEDNGLVFCNKINFNDIGMLLTPEGWEDEE